MARRQRLPGQYHTTFRVDVSEPGVSRGDDGRTQQEWFEAGGMMATTTYIGDLERVDGRWSLAIQWIDSTNTAHKLLHASRVGDGSEIRDGESHEAVVIRQGETCGNSTRQDNGHSSVRAQRGGNSLKPTYRLRGRVSLGDTRPRLMWQVKSRDKEKRRFDD